MRKIVYTALYLTAPGLVTLLLLIPNNISGTVFWGTIITIYLLTILGLFHYFCSNPRPCHFSLLLLGLTMPPVVMFLYEYRNPGFFQYLVTALFMVFYSVPFLLIALITYAVISIKKQKADYNSGIQTINDSQTAKISIEDQWKAALKDNLGKILVGALVVCIIILIALIFA